jgi:hypothetical protein
MALNEYWKHGTRIYRSFLSDMREGQSSLPQEVDSSREIAFIILQSIFTNLRANAERILDTVLTLTEGDSFLKLLNGRHEFLRNTDKERA